MALPQIYMRRAKRGIAATRETTGRSIILYAIAFAFAGLTPIMLLPILTSELTAAEVGQVTSFVIIAVMIGTVCGLTTHGLVTVRYFKDTPQDLAKLLTAAVIVVGVTHAAVALGLLAWPDPFVSFTSLPSKYMLLAVVIGFAFAIKLISLGIMQASQHPGLYLASRILQSFVEIVGCVVLIYLVAATPDARIVSYTFAILACALFGASYLMRRKLWSPRPDKAAAEKVLRFGVPMVPHVLAGQLLINLDRLMVSYVLGIEALGVFMVASQLGMALSLVIEPLNRTLAPWLFGALTEREEGIERKIVRYSYIIFAGLLGLALLSASVFYLLYPHIFPLEYAEAKTIIFPLAIGMAFQGMYYGVVNYLFFAEATGRLSVASTATVAVGALLSFLLTSNFGLMGAALSFMLTNAALFAVVWLVSSRSVPMPWAFWRKEAV